MDVLWGIILLGRLFSVVPEGVLGGTIMALGGRDRRGPGALPPRRLVTRNVSESDNRPASTR